jgi:hypothetical protein
MKPAVSVPCKAQPFTIGEGATPGKSRASIAGLLLPHEPRTGVRHRLVEVVGEATVYRAAERVEAVLTEAGGGIVGAADHFAYPIVAERLARFGQVRGSANGTDPIGVEFPSVALDLAATEVDVPRNGGGIGDGRGRAVRVTVVWERRCIECGSVPVVDDALQLTDVRKPPVRVGGEIEILAVPEGVAPGKSCPPLPEFFCHMSPVQLSITVSSPLSMKRGLFMQTFRSKKPS